MELQTINKPNRNAYLQIIQLLIYAAGVALILRFFVQDIRHLLTVNYTGSLEFIIVLGQLAFQSLFLRRKDRKHWLIYSVNLMTVSLWGALALIPLLIIHHFYALSDDLLLGYFFTVVMLMFLDHRRRVKKLELPWYLCYTWVLYRCLILLFIV